MHSKIEPCYTKSKNFQNVRLFKSKRIIPFVKQTNNLISFRRLKLKSQLNVHFHKSDCKHLSRQNIELYGFSCIYTKRSNCRHIVISLFIKWKSEYCFQFLAKFFILQIFKMAIQLKGMLKVLHDCYRF